MIQKDTNDLLNKLISTPDLSRFLSENQEEFDYKTFPETLLELFKKKKISKASLARKAKISNVYLYQMLSGSRNPTRDRVLCLCFGLSATLEEAQTLLKYSGYTPLHVKNRRDAIIIYGLTHSVGLNGVNDYLLTEHEERLF